MTSKPEVSVIIPTRNRWAILSRSALPAALMQEDVCFEVIVVDDGSDDETQRGLARLGNSAVRVLRNDVSRGVSAARNRGIEAAGGEWLAFLDDDDIWAPRKLRSQIDLARERGAGFAFSSSVTLDRDRRCTAYRIVRDATDVGSAIRRTNVVPAGCSNVIAREDVMRRVGGFDEHLSMIADWDLWLRLARETTSAQCTDIHVGYLNHEGNMAVRTPRAIFRESKYLVRKHRMSTPEQAVDRLAPVRQVAWENFWAGHRGRAARILLQAGILERNRRDLSRGVRFLVWSGVPDRVSQALWRLRHLPSAVAPEVPAAPSRPEWLEIYDSIAGRAALGSPVLD